MVDETLVAVHHPGEVQAERGVEDHSVLGARHRRDGEGGRRDQGVVYRQRLAAAVLWLIGLSSPIAVANSRIFSIPTVYGSPSGKLRPTND